MIGPGPLRCLVIGAGGGLGIEFVRRLLDEGHDVIATARPGPTPDR